MPVPAVQLAMVDDAYAQSSGWAAAPDAPALLARVADRSLTSITVDQPDGSQLTYDGQQVVDVGFQPYVVHGDGTATDMWGRRQGLTVGALVRAQDADGRNTYPPGSVNATELSDAKGWTPPAAPMVDPSSQLAKDLAASGLTTAVDATPAIDYASPTTTETGTAVASAKTRATLMQLVPWALIALAAWYFLHRRRAA